MNIHTTQENPPENFELRAGLIISRIIIHRRPLPPSALDPSLSYKEFQPHILINFDQLPRAYIKEKWESDN